jgi:anti-anti-sigma factor
MDRPKIRYLTLDQQGDVAVIDVTAVEIDTPALAREFGNDLELLLQARPAEKFLLNFSHTKYMSSSAFASVLGFGKRAGEAGLTVHICGFIPQIRFGADILGIGRILPIHETRREGLEALQSK